MARQRRRVRRNGEEQVSSIASDIGNAMQQVELEYMDISDIAEYEFNPRENEDAIAPLMHSIKEFGFLIPVVVDDDNVLAAGHTRIEAAKRLGVPSVPVVRASFLSPDQIDRFRIVDNQIASLSRFDMSLLGMEVARLSDGFDFTMYGFNREQIDCLSDMVADDCLGQQEEEEQGGHTGSSETDRRVPDRTRMVIGEFILYVPYQEFRDWAHRVRADNDFNDDNIEHDLLNRLGFEQ